MLNIRPLIPLELRFVTRHAGTSWAINLCSPAFGSSYNFEHRGVQVAFLNNQLWARGLHHIGKVFIIAAGFDKDEEAQEYYLYISPDFYDLHSATTTDENETVDTSDYDETDNKHSPTWYDVAIASIGHNDNVYAFFSDEPDPTSGGFCIASLDDRVIDTSEKSPSWKHLFEDEENDKPNDIPIGNEEDSDEENNARIFFDYANASALWLHNEGAQFFFDSLEPHYDFSCNNLRQWLAPADLVEAVSDTGVVAKADNSAFFTELQRDFHRNIMSPCVLPLSGQSYSVGEDQFVKLSVATETNSSNTSISLQVKHSNFYNVHPTVTAQSSVNWDNVYREPVKLSYTGKNQVPDGFSLVRYALPLSDFDGDFLEEQVSHSSPFQYPYKENNQDNRFLFGGLPAGVPVYPIWATDIEFANIMSYSQIIDLEDWPNTHYQNYYVKRFVEDWGTPYWGTFYDHFYYYDTVSTTLAIFDPQNPTFRLFLPVSTSVNWISKAALIYSENNIAFELRYLNDDWFVPADITIESDPFGGDYVAITHQMGENLSNVVVGSIPEKIQGYNAAYELGIKDCLFEAKKRSLVQPSIALKAVRAYNNSSLSYAIFQSRDTNIYFSLDFNVPNINTTLCWNFPDHSTIFRKSNGSLYSRVNYHIADAWAFDEQNQLWDEFLYFFRSEYKPSIFNFDDDLERCKSS